MACPPSPPRGETPALNVMARGDEVIVVLGGGVTLSLSAHEAEVSAQRLLDAADIARCLVPRRIA